MIHRLPSVVFRSVLCVLLVAALGSCRIFHPFRIPTPKPSPEFKAKQAADKKAKKAREAEAKANSGAKTGGLSFLKRKPKVDKGADAPTEEAATDVAAPIGGAAPAPAAADNSSAATAESRTLPTKSTVKYDKELIMKKPKLIRRRVHKPTWSFHPGQSIRNFFKYRLHGKPNYSPKHRPEVPSPEAAPDAAPGGAPDTAPTPDAAPAASPDKKP